MKKKLTALHLFCGAGGMALGFKKAGFETVGAFDFDATAIAAHDYLTGDRGTVADLATMSPAALRAACTGWPDAVFSSPPCKGNSGCLPAAVAATERYQEMNNLAFRGVWIALEAWLDKPPALFIIENVPRIMTRSRALLDDLNKLFCAYGYAVRETTHDCGELGGLAQHRRRFLMVARHMHQVREFLYVPPKKRVRGVGEVLGELPVPAPGSTEGGPMHRLPRMSTKNWVRLALIPAGGDWRDLPDSVALPARDARQNGPWGVNDWNRGGHTVVGAATVRNTWSSVADPRLAGSDERHCGKYGVEDWKEGAHTVIGESRTGKAWAGVADPRLGCTPRAGTMGVIAPEATSGTVIGVADPQNGAFAYADPRIEAQRREGSLGVTDWQGASVTVIGKGIPQNGPWQVADPRLATDPFNGTMHVCDWPAPSHTVLASAGQSGSKQASHSVADPRVPELAGAPLEWELKRPIHLVIRAIDGAWHRPMTTLELAALQSVPTWHKGAWLDFGVSHERARELIGNMVPPEAAHAIGRSAAVTLLAAAAGGLLLSSDAVWVRRREREVHP